jgi:hypothetical protein
MEVTVAMRLNLASAFMFTDVECNNEKALTLTAWQRQGGAVVSVPNEPTGVGAVNTRAGLTSTHPRERTASKLAFPLSPRSLGWSTYETGNERPILRDSGSDNRGSY